MAKTVVVTGAGAGVGRATVEEFARAGYNVALLSRDPGRLDKAVADLHHYGVHLIAIPTDVADSDAVEAAADKVEAAIGPIDVWVNCAMATILAPLSEITAAEFERATKVTYLGQVHGTMSALKRMRARNKGVIINVGSALAHRSIPLQSAYCGAQFAVRGFTNSVRSELIHDGIDIAITEVELPAMNTPRYDWLLNKTGRRPRPMEPIFQPEVGARAILFAATHRRRQIWLGLPTLKTIIGNRIAPGLLDAYLAITGYAGQLEEQGIPTDAPSNLFLPVPGDFGAHGRFDYKARDKNWLLLTDRHRTALLLGALGLGVLWLRGRSNRRRD